MGLLLSMLLPTGVTASFWVISSLKTDLIAKSIMVILSGFLSQTAYNGGSTALTTKTVIIKGVAYTALAGQSISGPLTASTNAAIYKAIIAMPAVTPKIPNAKVVPNQFAKATLVTN